MIKPFIKICLLFCILGLTLVSYLPGLAEYFIFDDGANIRQNPYLRIDSLDFDVLWQAATWGNTRPWGRPLSMLSFALNHYFFGMTPYFFKVVNLAIHLVNGVLIFVLTRLLLAQHLSIRATSAKNTSLWIAIAVTALWLLHPFNLTGVLYVVQRMTSLSALFTLCGLILYLHGRQAVTNGRKTGFLAIISAILVFTPLAVLCKENGVLLPALIFVTEASLFRWDTPDRRNRYTLIAIVGASAVIPLLVGLLYILGKPGLILDGYAVRDFSITERLMTEARVLWFYLRMILLPELGEMGLHHDDFVISRSLFSPWTTFPAIFGLLVLIAVAIALRKKHPIFTFGITFFLVGHIIESTVIPLEIAFEHRNYLPMLGIVITLSYYALRRDVHPSSTRIRQCSLLILLALFASLTASRAREWGNSFQMRILEVERHPRSVRAHTDLAAIYNYAQTNSLDDALFFYKKARIHYQQAANIAPSDIAGLLGMLVINAERNLPIEEDLLTALEHRLATVVFSPPNKNSLIGAIRCMGNSECPVGSEVVNRLYRATLSNPLLTSPSKEQIIAEFGNLIPEIRPRIKQ